jgi:hypothetical protein
MQQCSVALHQQQIWRTEEDSQERATATGAGQERLPQIVSDRNRINQILPK